MVEEKIVTNTKNVLKIAEKEGCSPRMCAMKIAKERVLKKCKICKV